MSTEIPQISVQDARQWERLQLSASLLAKKIVLGPKDGSIIGMLIPPVRHIVVPGTLRSMIPACLLAFNIGHLTGKPVPEVHQSFNGLVPDVIPDITEDDPFSILYYVVDTWSADEDEFSIEDLVSTVRSARLMIGVPNTSSWLAHFQGAVGFASASDMDDALIHDASIRLLYGLCVPEEDAENTFSRYPWEAPREYRS